MSAASCFLFKTLKVTVVYVHVLNSPPYLHHARRFVETYVQHPAGYDHETLIVCNGGVPNDVTVQTFKPLPNVSFFLHDNSGYDIGAFQHVARDSKANLVVFFGASTYINRDDWLARMVEAFLNHGDAQYGAMGNRGNIPVRVWPHIRTTAFWMEPSLLAAYPKQVTNPQDRHPFEHGQDCFTAWVEKQGLKSWVVTATRELLWAGWNSDPNGFQQGDQSALLAGDHVCEPPYYPTR